MQEFVKYYSSGNLAEAEEILLKVLDYEKKLPEAFKVAVYNNLGAVSTLSGKYDNALVYFNKAEEIESSNNSSSKSLGDIYINKANILVRKRIYTTAFEYFEKSIDIYKSSSKNNPEIETSIASAYLNLGIAYIDVGEIKKALDYLNKSMKIRLKNKLPGLELVYLNLAKAYVKSGENLIAEESFKKSINFFINEYGHNYYRLAEAYFDYGVFLKNEKQYNESLVMLKKALDICLSKYGLNHSRTSLAYKLIGDNYFARSFPDSALKYYQKSLIAIVPGFNSPDIKDNPLIDSSLFDIRLLDNLKSKARALEMFAEQTPGNGRKAEIMEKGVETIELALNLIERIRKGYPDEESRLYIAENERETYDFAVNLTYKLYTLSQNEYIKQKLYEISCRSKSAVLRDILNDYVLQREAGIPDSLTGKINSLTAMSSAYNNLILEETRKTKPDSNKIRYWKDEIFRMNREKEKIIDLINTNFPLYTNLSRKLEPVPLRSIQKQLKKDETILDYYICACKEKTDRALFIFIITPKSLQFVKSTVDSMFYVNIFTLNKAFANFNRNTGSSPGSTQITGALSYLYDILFRPVEDKLGGNRVIIIPDGEISQVPFEALIDTPPQSGMESYDGLSYLINKYVFSWGYSSSLINSQVKNSMWLKVYAFAPDYSAFETGGGGAEALKKAEEEIKSIYRWFKGESYTGIKATETNFRNVGEKPGIMHLAMHLSTDSANSKYSFLVFDPRNDSLSDGKLYNYEISLSRIKSPVIVLSACNSGGGTFYQSEGFMSIARSFILAGASSVIKTSWEINDETSAEIMTSFYKYLSKGKAKDEALRLAKLEYISGHPPVYTNPYYWAAYEVLGDNAPVRNKSNRMLAAVVVIFVFASLSFVYLRRRKIFSAFSRK